MPIAAEHAFKEKSTKLLILLPLRTIYNRTFQCETPCRIDLFRCPKYKDGIISEGMYFQFGHSLQKNKHKSLFLIFLL